MWETVDPDGQRVVLTETVWEHITRDHTDLDLHALDVLGIVRVPDISMPGRFEDEIWFYARGVGPSRWLKVVVHYEAGEGRIVTAFARRAMP